MADVVRRVDYYYAMLRDEVGTGARVLEELAARRVSTCSAFRDFRAGDAFSSISFPRDPPISSAPRARCECA